MAALPLRKSFVVWFTIPGESDGPFFARYQLGRWRGLNRWRGWTLEKRRSRAPYLLAGDGSRVHVQIVLAPEVHHAA